MRAFDGGHDWRAHVKFIRESAELTNLRSRFPGLCDDIDRLCLRNEQLQTQLTQCAEQRDQLIRDVYGALVPLAKPERVEYGQRWARIDVIARIIPPNDEHVEFKTFDYVPWAGALLSNNNWIYLGTDKG
jgi:hypothetical protein